MTARKYPNQVEPSRIDKEFHLALRANIEEFYKRIVRDYYFDNAVILDVAPEVHDGIFAYLPGHAKLETLDLDPNSGSTYIADLCQENASVPESRFDIIICTEVLEHTLDPFAAVRELRRILKPGGRIFASTPFNFRIHGPLPDCWRFTEHGLRALFKDFEVEELVPLDTPDRPLMPIQYTLVSRKPAGA